MKPLSDYYNKKVIITTKDGKIYRGVVTMTWDEYDDEDGPGLGVSPAGVALPQSDIESIKELG